MAANQFDLARSRAKQQEGANLAAQKEALQRRAAQLGGGISGAFIKQEQVAADESAKRLGDVNEGIDVAQAAEEERKQEIEAQRSFQRGEREAAQQFTAGMQGKGFEFTKAEREAAQKFADEQARGQRDWATGERLSGQEFAALESSRGRDFAKSESELARRQQADQFDKQLGLSREQFAHEIAVDDFNMKLSERIQKFNEEPGMFEQATGLVTGGLIGSGGGPLATAKSWVKKNKRITQPKWF